MMLTYGCGRLTCQFCYGDDIAESEIAFHSEQRERRMKGGVQAPAPPRPPSPPTPSRPTPRPRECRNGKLTLVG
jgi:hypothetical protein